MRDHVLAIDPGTEKSAYVLWNGETIQEKDILANDDILMMLEAAGFYENMGLKEAVLAVEMVSHCGSGMAVGKDVFWTCVWIGRFIQAWERKWNVVYRKDVKLHLCGTARAKDKNVRQALIDRFGEAKMVEVPVTDEDGKPVLKKSGPSKGTPKLKKVSNGSPLHGVASHLWAALAVGVTWHDLNSKGG